MKANTGTRGFKWKMFVGGLLAVLVGYVFLAMGNTTLAPVFLVSGYCVLVPLAFL